MNSIRFGKFFGISLELHYTFILLIVFMTVLIALIETRNFFSYMLLLVFLFASVFIHELCHSIVSVFLGIRVEKIILLPIGGISVAKEMPKKALHEFLISIAGPLFNFAIVLGISIIVVVFPEIPFPSREQILSVKDFSNAVLNYPLFALLYVNLMLGAFNLFVPALPLDGGRVLRSILSSLIGFNRATHISTKISLFFVIILGLIGYAIGNIILIIIAVFVFLGATGEDKIVIMKESLQGIKITHLINKKPFFLNSNITVKNAFEKFQEKNKLSALMEKQGKIFLLELDLLHELKKEKWSKIKAIKIAKALPVIQINLTADKAMEKLIKENTEVLPVFSGKKFIGVIEEKELLKRIELNKFK